MKKLEKLSRAEMKNVKGGKLPPTCPATSCTNMLGKQGICSTTSESQTTCACIYENVWDGTTVCQVA
jgi:hypothetical protein